MWIIQQSKPRLALLPERSHLPKHRRSGAEGWLPFDERQTPGNYRRRLRAMAPNASYAI
jgi:hypothetical protein